jgi:hypothetical protein
MGSFRASCGASFERGFVLNYSQRERDGEERGKDTGALARTVPDPRRGALTWQSANVLLRDGLQPGADQTGDRRLAPGERDRPPQLRRGRPSLRGSRLVS